jgi:hypothetical protein
MTCKSDTHCDLKIIVTTEGNIVSVYAVECGHKSVAVVEDYKVLRTVE